MKDTPLDDIGIYDADDDDEDDDDQTARWDEPVELGPDERDSDLMDGSWEQRFYRGETQTRDWNAIVVGVSLLVLMAILLPAILVLV